MIDELFTSESLSQVYASLHGFIHANFDNTQTLGMFLGSEGRHWLYYSYATIDILCYDDGCHLRRYARNCARSQVTQATSKLASLNIVIDKLHFKGHTDSWCHSNCNPYDVKELDEVNAHWCRSKWLYVAISVGWHWNLWANLFMVVTIYENYLLYEQAAFPIFYSVWSSQ